MSQPPSQPLLPVLQEPPPNPIPLKEAHTLITTFTTFLTVGIHNILFYRNIYPPTTFLSARAYNFPVHQNRHPKVCSWISDAVDAVAAQLATGTVDRIAVVVHAPLQPDIEWNSQRRKGKEKDDGTPDFSAVPPGAVLERWMFDVARFPGWPGGADSMRDFGKSLRRREEENDGDDEDDEDLPAEDEREPKSGEEEAAAAHAGQGPASKTNLKINWTDVEEQFRAVLRRLSYAAEKLEPLPEGCTFTVAVELKEEGQAPIGYPQPWIPSPPNLQKSTQKVGSDLGGVRSMPLRAVEAGPMFFECWVEEGKAKDLLKDSTQSQYQETTSSAS